MFQRGNVPTMNNALETYRVEKGWTFARLAREAGYPHRATVLKHCKADVIPGEAAARYHLKLGIPLESLRPDLAFPAPGGQAMAEAGA
jgi:hypothetical protein